MLAEKERETVSEEKVCEKPIKFVKNNPINIRKEKKITRLASLLVSQVIWGFFLFSPSEPSYLFLFSPSEPSVEKRKKDN